jgi:hypothetical protein
MNGIASNSAATSILGSIGKICMTGFFSVPSIGSVALGCTVKWKEFLNDRLFCEQKRGKSGSRFRLTLRLAFENPSSRPLGTLPKHHALPAV